MGFVRSFCRFKESCEVGLISGRGSSFCLMYWGSFSGRERIVFWGKIVR